MNLIDVIVQILIDLSYFVAVTW